MSKNNPLPRKGISKTLIWSLHKKDKLTGYYIAQVLGCSPQYAYRVIKELTRKERHS